MKERQQEMRAEFAKKREVERLALANRFEARVTEAEQSLVELQY